MRKVYLIYAAYNNTPLGIVVDKNDAIDYCKRFSKPRGFQRLTCVPIVVLDTTESPWRDGYDGNESKIGKVNENTILLHGGE